MRFFKTNRRLEELERRVRDLEYATKMYLDRDKDPDIGNVVRMIMRDLGVKYVAETRREGLEKTHV